MKKKVAISAALSAAGVIIAPFAFAQEQVASEAEAPLQQAATSNLADFVNTMPVFANSQTPTNQYHQSSNGLAGLNTLNLRSVGSSRTLVLIDGQRSVGSTTTGLVDINNIPQDLVQ